ncbi:MAG: hypothetical protein AAF658_03320 [Myxococcota bacterium]
MQPVVTTAPAREPRDVEVIERRDGPVGFLADAVRSPPGIGAIVGVVAAVLFGGGLPLVLGLGVAGAFGGSLFQKLGLNLFGGRDEGELVPDAAPGNAPAETASSAELREALELQRPARLFYIDDPARSIPVAPLTSEELVLRRFETEAEAPHADMVAVAYRDANQTWHYGFIFENALGGSSIQPLPRIS